MASDDLIEQYVDYASYRCDAPRDFHLLCGYWIVSSVFGRYTRTMMAHSVDGERPNIWAIILGTSRLTRKTASTYIAKKTLKQICNPNILPSSGSPEGFLEAIGGLESGESAIWFRDEVGGFFRSLNHKSYMEGMREDMSQLYSAKGIDRKLVKSECHIPDGIYMTSLVNGPLPCHSYMTERDFEGGFMNRFLTVYRKDRDITYNKYNKPNKRHDVEVKREKVIKNFQNKRKLFLKHDDDIIVNIPSHIGEWLNKYDMEIEKRIKVERNKNPDSLFAPYLGEAADYFHKLMVLRRIARDPPPEHGMLTLSREDLIRAHEDIEKFTEYGRQMIKDVEETPVSKEVKTEKKNLMHIYSHIEKAGKLGISWRDLMRSTHRKRNDLGESVMALIDQQMICAIRTDHDSNGRWKSTGRKGVPLKFSVIEYEPDENVVSPRFVNEILNNT